MRAGEGRGAKGRRGGGGQFVAACAAAAAPEQLTRRDEWQPVAASGSQWQPVAAGGLLGGAIRSALLKSVVWNGRDGGRERWPSINRYGSRSKLIPLRG